MATEPMLNSIMRSHPDWHVEVYNPNGLGAAATGTRGYLAEYDEAIREAKEEAWREGFRASEQVQEDIVRGGWDRPERDDDVPDVDLTRNPYTTN